ncbi:MAG: hypothetical protein U5J99_08695 [Parvularculaceae bacterium]|nr:hypothetical protein [Parvularculaceae bacterium]
MPTPKSPNERKAARASAETAAMAEVRNAADKQRNKSDMLRQQRLERDAALPAKKKAAKRVMKTDLNLAQTQRIAKK